MMTLMPAEKPRTLAVGGRKAATSIPREDHTRSVGTAPCSFACTLQTVNDTAKATQPSAALQGEAPKTGISIFGDKVQCLWERLTRRAVIGVPRMRTTMPM